MPMAYDPKDAISCLPPGEYEAVLSKVEDKTSKKGNEMQHLVWTVFAPNGRSRRVDDYIVNPSSIFKLRKIARALGQLPEFENGAFQVDNFIDCHVLVELGVEEQQGYDEKNVIGNYRALGTEQPKPAPRNEEDIPF